MAKSRGAKKVVVLLGSPRRKGNSAALAAQIAAGATSAGADVETIFLDDMKIAPCRACEACHQGGAGRCVIDDDMQAIYPKLEAAAAIVFASPVYWFNMSAQTKLALDRCYALQGPKKHAFAGKRMALALAYAEPDPLASGCANAVRTFQDAFRFCGAELVGTVHGSAWEAGQIRSNRMLLRRARELGRKLVAAGG